MKFILSIDQGTTGTTAALINSSDLSFVAKVNREFPQIFPKPGHVEHDLNDIWTTVGATVTEVITKAGVKSTDIISIGITNQRETICAFNKSGTPLHNAIVWQDRRTAEYCSSLTDELKTKIKSKTGLPTDPYFSGTKIKWLIDNIAEVSKAQIDNDLCFGTIDTFLLYKLTSGASFYTEPSNASRTLIFDIHKGKWSSELADFLGVSINTLPEVLPSFGNFGKTSGLSFLPDGIPITGILGDQQSALFGQGGHEKGMSKCTYGTGAFFLLNTGTEAINSENGLLTTVAYQEGETLYYALEGSCYIAGAAVQWLRDSLHLIESSPAVEKLALEASNESCENILFLPFFTGLGSPYWIGNSQAAIVGLTRDSGRAQIARATLEGIALSINDLLQSVEQDSSISLSELRVDGGAVANNFLMQIQSNISGIKVVRPEIIETTVFGAACASAIGAGLFNKQEVAKIISTDKEFEPIANVDYENSKKKLWKTMIKKLYL